MSAPPTGQPRAPRPLPPAPFAWLLEGRFDAWFGNLADQRRTLWLLQHIPKTAGTSLRAEIAAQVRPQINICLNQRGTGSLPSFASLDQALDRFEQLSAERRFRFASGHLDRLQVERVTRIVPGTRLVTMLRDPVARAISDYRYQRTPKHPPHQAFITRYPDFKSWLRAPDTQNRLYDFLCKSSQDSVDTVIQDLENNYSFVGLTETYPLSRRILFRAMGQPLPAAEERRNQTQPSDHNDIPDLDELQGEILAANDKDAAIFRHVRRRLQAVREPLRDWLKANPLPAAPSKPAQP